MKEIVFDRKQGLIGIRRLAVKNEEKEHSCNYVIDILEPISMARVEKTVSSTGFDWQPLPKTDPRTQFIKLFDILEGGEADWDYSIRSGDEQASIEEAYIQNRHAVFELIRKLFVT